MGPAAGNPAPHAERAGTPPRGQHGDGEGRRAARVHDQRGRAGARRGDSAARQGVGLAELRQHGVVPQGRRVHRGGEAVRRARAPCRDEHRSRGDAGEQELQPAHFIAAALRRSPVFALEAEVGYAQGAGERGRRLERRGPLAQATRRERRAYLLTQQRRIRHLDPDPEDADAGCHRLHPPRGARRPQVRRRPARWRAPLPAARRRILQDPRQGAGGDRRGPGRGQSARVNYVSTPAALADAVAALRREPLVAADTEAASFHRYHDRIFLVQLSSPTLTAIIDPLAIADLSPVGGLLDDTHVEKIFHDADYDLRILDRDYGFRARRLFDTRIAAQLAGEPAVGPPGPFGKDAARELAQEHQKAGWARRPPSPALLAHPPAGTAPPPAPRRAPAELRGIAALPPSLAARHGPALLDGVQRALALAESELPRVERAPRQARDPAVEARVERLKAVRNRAAAELALDPGVLCGRSILEAVARAPPPPNDAAGLARIGELRRWQIEAFGDALLETLEQP